jgi:hypothetical protein
MLAVVPEPYIEQKDLVLGNIQMIGSLLLKGVQTIMPRLVTGFWRS